MRTSRAFAVTGLTAAMVVASTPARAESPPASWTSVRTLTCDGETVNTALTPGGPGTPYVVVGSTEVLVPKHIQVTFPGTSVPITTLHVPGFDANGRSTLSCSYTDPAGLFVELLLLRS